jgi:hypothetical protein
MITDGTHKSRTTLNRLGSSESDKLREQYLKDEIDYSISVCITSDKEETKRAYDLRNGVRDLAKFEYLWKAYGLEFPSTMKHVPVLKSKFDALVGVERLSPISNTITYNDKGSLEYLQSEKTREVAEQAGQDLVDTANRQISQTNLQNAGISTPFKEPTFKERMKDVSDNVDKKKTKLEIGTQRMLIYQIENNKLKSKFNTMFDDLVTAGEEYYQCKVIEIGRKPLFRALNPKNFFYTKTSERKFVAEGDRAVYREELTPDQVLHQYGHMMKPKDLKRFKRAYYKHISSGVEIVDSQYLEVEQENTLDDVKQGSMDVPYIYVYYCEWKANNEISYNDYEYDDDIVENNENFKKKSKYRLDRYEGYRVGDDIYCGAGLSKYIQRSTEDPSNCSLTMNGAAYQDRNGKPYSLVLNTEDIADKIDILHYHWESLVAMSGTKAVAVNYPDIPAWMGTDPMERLMKFIGVMKQGAAVVDLAQTGNGVGAFANMGDLDMTLDNSINVIIEMLEYLDQTASKITGVNAQMIGQIGGNDGKAVTEMSLKQTSVVTQPLFSTHSDVMGEALTDLMNACRISYKDGFMGSVILGDQLHEVFTLDAERFSLADINVHVTDGAEELRTIDELKSLSMEMVKNQMGDVNTIVDISTIKSLSEIREKLKEASSSKEENPQRANDQAQGEMAGMAQRMQQAEQAAGQAEGAKLQIDSQKVTGDQALKEKELSIDKEYNDAKLALDAKRVELEKLQLVQGKGNAQEVRNS